MANLKKSNSIGLNLKNTRWLNREFGTYCQREEIKRLLLKNGYDPEKCQHGCWDADSLAQRYFSKTLVDFVWHNSLQKRY
jgi:hypothetical protein